MYDVCQASIMPVVFMDTCQVTDTCEVTPDRRPRNVEEEKVGVACFRPRCPTLIR